MTRTDDVIVRVTHRFSASAERVYDAWLDPEKASQFFFATPTGFIVRCEVDARIGGNFLIVDRRDGEDVAHAGTFLELDRPRRIVFTFAVEQYSKERTRVTIDIAPLENGCEATITHVLPAEYREFAGRTGDGWRKMLEYAAEVVKGEPETCGEGVAQQASLPARIAPLFAALAETLEQHRVMLVRGEANSAAEDNAYRSLAETFADLAARVQSAAVDMANCRSLPVAAHDETAYGPAHLAAFERFVSAQNALLAVLKVAAKSDQRMLDGMKAKG